MTFQIRVAGYCIRISSLFDDVYKQCAPYEDQSSEPEFNIELRLEDVIREAELNHEALPVSDARMPELETLAVYRKIAEALLERDVLLMHGAVVAVGDAAVMFAAPSGTGKTTHARLWLENIPDSYIVNGDKPLLRFENDAVFACGTPWAGKENYQRNCQVPLRAICFQRRADAISVTPLTETGGIFQALMRQVYIPYEEKHIQKTMRLVGKLAREVRFFNLECDNYQENVALTVWEHLKPALKG